MKSVLFPLPLTPFERYYLADDCPDYPTAYPIELSFSGPFDRDRFAAALAEALARHPLIGALVDDSTHPPRWIARGRDRIAVDWADESVPVSHPAGAYIDLRTSAGLRVWVRTAAQSTRVVLQFHHACCDGLAAFQFIADMLACYKRHAGIGAQSAQLRELDVEQLRQRGVYVGPPRKTVFLGTALKDVWTTACLWSRIYFQTPAILAPRAAGDRGAARRLPADTSINALPRPAAAQQILPFESETLSVDESAALRQIAASLGAAVNDLVLRDFLLTLHAWNKKYAGRPHGRLRLNVPVNVRLRDESRMPAANRIGFAFVTCDAADCDDPSRALAAVRNETRRTKEQVLALYFLGGLEFATKIPGALRWGLGRNRSFATAVMSNAGRFCPEVSPNSATEHWSCGDLVLESIAAVPPIRRLTRAAGSLIEYAGKTTICLRCDPVFFDQADTRALLDDYVAQVRQTLKRGT